MSTTFELTIRPRKGWQAIDFKEAYLYRELLVFLVWRDIKIRYRQTLLGGLWAVLQPLIAMLIFTFVFNRLAGVKSDGPPYQLFAFAGLVPWTFFSTSVTQSSNSLISNQQLVSKVYFPRIFIPLGAIGALLLDLLLSLGLLALMMLYYHWPLTATVLWLPVFLAGAVLAAAGTGLTLSALNVSFRDVKYAVPFMVQMGIFITPVIYPARYLPHRWQILMGLNPMAGVVIGFRHALLGSPASWEVMGLSLGVSVCLFVSGLLIFRRMESRFADII
jgi:lipopolysaccharide transport system permease protein